MHDKMRADICGSLFGTVQESTLLALQRYNETKEALVYSSLWWDGLEHKNVTPTSKMADDYVKNNPEIQVWGNCLIFLLFALRTLVNLIDLPEGQINNPSLGNKIVFLSFQCVPHLGLDQYLNDFFKGRGLPSLASTFPCTSLPEQENTGHSQTSLRIALKTHREP